MTRYGAVRGRSRLSGRGQAALTVTVALAAGCLVLAGSGTAAAAPTPACPAGSAPGTVVCAYTGGAQYWTVPAGVTQATFTVYGASGGASALDAAPGSGAEVTGTLAVSAGTVYQVNVGQAGGYDGIAAPVPPSAAAARAAPTAPAAAGRRTSGTVLTGWLTGCW